MTKTAKLPPPFPYADRSPGWFERFLQYLESRFPVAKTVGDLLDEVLPRPEPAPPRPEPPDSNGEFLAPGSNVEDPYVRGALDLPPTRPEPAIAPADREPGWLQRALDADADAVDSPPRRERETLLAEAARLIGGTRQEDYGTPEDNFGNIALLWDAYFLMNRKRKPDEPFITRQTVVDLNILLKIARSATKPKRDNYVDIAGYAGCAERCGLAGEGKEL